MQAGNSRSWWFHLFGDKIVLATAFAALAPAIYALISLRRSQLLLGFVLGVVWLVPFGLLLVALHNRRIVRLPISIACTVAVLAAAAFVDAGM